MFSVSEGDRWFERNLSSNFESDKVMQILKIAKILPKKTLEIGCSNGKRLDLIRSTFNSKCWGVDPSIKAIESGKKNYPELMLSVGTADSLKFKDNSFDVIIFGFCLYLCDRDDLFKISFEVDRCLKDGGVIVINDFYSTLPYKNKYSHLEGIYSYKMDYSKMFKWNPYYVEEANMVYGHSGFELKNNPDERVSVVILKKNRHYAYPEEIW